MEKVITIVSSEVRAAKTPGKTYLEVIDHDNVKFSCWDESLWNDLGKNASAKIEFEIKGIFKNIVAVVPMAKALADQAKEDNPPEPVDKEGQRKNKVNALLNAVNLAVADKIKPTQVIFVADLYYAYLEGNITVPEEVLIKLVQDQVKAELKIKKGEQDE